MSLTNIRKVFYEMTPYRVLFCICLLVLVANGCIEQKKNGKYKKRPYLNNAKSHKAQLATPGWISKKYIID